MLTYDLHEEERHETIEEQFWNCSYFAKSWGDDSPTSHMGLDTSMCESSTSFCMKHPYK